ncbi:hypothetical protein ScPMuIL_000623 [Solemya velum]
MVQMIASYRMKKVPSICGLQNMKRIQFDDPNDKVDVVRRIKLKVSENMITAAGISLPDSWKPMSDKTEIDVFPIPNLTNSIVDVEKQFMDSVQKGNHAFKVPNVQKLKVIEIKRIQNKTLYKQYAAKRLQLEKQNPTGTKNEQNCGMEQTRQLYSINTNGFNRGYCGKHGTWFGQGVYFTPDASYSARAWLAQPGVSQKQFMYQSLVLTGEYTLGKKDMRAAPSKDPKDPLKLYDSVVNDVNNPEEFVIFHDTQAYPEFLITFQC